MKKVQHGPHVYLHVDDDGHPCVSADDYELFDLIDDYLTEVCCLDFESAYIKNWPGEGDHTIIALSGIAYQDLVDSIKKLDLEELERVFLLNVGRKQKPSR